MTAMRARWEIDGTTFVVDFDETSTAERFCIRKPPELVERYLHLAPDFRGARIVELGIAAGGSAALLALLLEPAKLVSIEYQPIRVEALDTFIVDHDLAERVRPHYGIDQADADAVRHVVEQEFDAPLDLVIDDASHLWDKTRASFDLLFPLLRPRGLYIIEDWAAHYTIARAIAAGTAGDLPDAEPRPPLARIGIELMLASSSAPAVIEEVTINTHWIGVRRGPAVPDGFSLSALYTDPFGWLANDVNWYGILTEP